MGRNVDDFIGYEIDDIITLSDLQTQSEYGKTNVDFRITEIREYHQPEDVFNYTAYIAEYKPDKEKDPRQIMFMILQVGSEFELRVYTLSMEGTAEELDPVLDPDKDDLIERFEVDLHFDGEPDLPVTWDRQGKSAFGIEVTSTESEDDEPDCKTIAEYFTNDEAKGNPHCFIEWTGDKDDGYIEVWYGCEIKPADVELFHIND
jgi:hypothetical protein